MEKLPIAFSYAQVVPNQNSSSKCPRKNSSREWTWVTGYKLGLRGYVHRYPGGNKPDYARQAASKEMIKTRKRGKICFVSSTLGYMALIGYASYAPAKHALRGLADTLRSELQLYSIDVHIFFPCTMFTPGYEEENKTKPKITLKIEESDSGLTAEQAARSMLTGLLAFPFSRSPLNPTRIQG
jgi:hypothetical protein